MKAWQLTLLAAATASSGAYAVQPDGMSLGSGVTFYPGVEVSMKNNDNVYRQPSGNTDSSVITRIRPNAGLMVDLGATQLNGFVQAESGSYDIDNNDNYLDMLVQGGADVELSSRHAVGANLSMKMGHDPRGSGATQGTAATSVVKPNEFDELTIDGDYTYGADTAFANVTAYAGSYSKEYSNNDTVTATLNHSKVKYGVKTGLRISSATQVVFELRQTQISYDDSAASSKDGSETRLLAGMSWDITGRTSGEFLVGNSSRQFDENTNDSDSRFAWEGNLSWSPRTYSTLTLTTGQRANETTVSGAAGGSHVANQNTSLNWDHEFSVQWSLLARMSLDKDEYVGLNRTDRTTGMGVTGVFSPNRNVDVKVNLDKNKKSSDLATVEYNQTIMGVAVELAF